MLVLSRKRGERLLIGDEIIITVLSNDQGKVRLGIDAPKDVLILREELAAKAGPINDATSIHISE
jgi:carbon storage regulator